MRARWVFAAVAASMLSLVGSASAAVRWQPAQTVTLVRGIPDPRVTIDGRGNASLVLSTATDASDETITRLAVRPPGTELFDRGPVAGTHDAEIATNPSGATAIAAVRDGRLAVTLYPDPGPPAGREPAPGAVVSIPEAGTSVDEPSIGIDALGRATVVWTAPPASSSGDSSSRVYAVEINPAGAVGPIQELTGPGSCRPVLDVNLRGDAAVVANCAESQNELFLKVPGGMFAATGDPFLYDQAPADVALDGAGRAYMVQTSRTNLGEGTSAYEVAWIGRATDGVTLFNRLGFVGGEDRDFTYDVEENGRAIAAWVSDGAVRYVIRQPSEDFGPVRSVPSGPAHGLSVVASQFGPSLVSWREHLGSGANPVERVRAAVLDIDGAARVASLGVRGDLAAPRDVPVSFAINEAGQAVGAWEQRCSPGGALAVMAVALDEASSNADPPCQDTRAPKVISTTKRASSRGRRLRVRLACDEACRLTANARVMQAGRRSPLATAKVARERRLAARRGAWIDFRLSAAESRRLTFALRARRRLSVRLAVSVRDRYDTGARRRLVIRLVR
jgi:hypothetical protein